LMKKGAGLEDSMSERCVFCDVNSMNGRILDESKNTITILSNPCLVKGHVLVMPKRHVEKLSEFNKEERVELIEQVTKIQEKLLEKFKGCDVRQNYRPFQKEDGLKIDHLHIHLQPRELFDELYEKCQVHEKKIFKKLNKEELDDLTKEVFQTNPMTDDSMKEIFEK